MTEMPAIPSVEDVTSVLAELNGRADATAILEKLVGRGFSRRRSQVAIQAAFEARRVSLNQDWTFSATPTRVAA